MLSHFTHSVQPKVETKMQITRTKPQLICSLFGIRSQWNAKGPEFEEEKDEKLVWHNFHLFCSTFMAWAKNGKTGKASWKHWRKVLH